MTPTILLLLGLVFLVCFFVLFSLLLRRASPQSAQLEEVTRQARGGEEEAGPRSWRSAVSVDQLAKPFALFGSFFASKANPDIVRRLMLAGYRKPAHVDIFLGSRLALPAVLGFAVALLFNESTLLFVFVAVIVGFFAPDMWLNIAIRKRRERIRLSLPDSLDLLSICMEAGLGLDQAVVRVGEELRVSHPDLSEEFLQVNLEQRAGAPRLAAWRSFADRADVESVRSFVAMLVQTERFGTPISKTLGIFSDGLRTQRRQKAEEMAAKTTIKLVLPLALFIFPDTFIVTVGPAIITVIRSAAHFLE
jgi:tight adherence protein C